MEVSVLHDAPYEEDHRALLTWTDQLVAMRALLHALRPLAWVKVRCRANGMYVRARMRMAGGGGGREPVWRCGAVQAWSKRCVGAEVGRQREGGE